MKRRDFVLKSALATSAIASSSLAFGKLLPDYSPNNTVNFGIIGTGDRGSALIPIINGITDCNVIGCCDVLPFRLRRGINKAPKAKGYTDYRKLLDNPNIDAVIISTTFNTHAKIAVDALDAGKHVYCEKTLAKGYSDIKKIIQNAKNSSKTFQTGHQYHSSRLYTHVVDLIKNGKIGKVNTFDCQWNRHWNWRRAVPKPEYEKAINWRMYRAFSGGLVAELCSHQIDFTNWVLNETPNKVTGFGGIDYYKDGRETYDNVHLIYNYASGVKARFTCLTSNAKDGYLIQVKGDKGTISIGFNDAWFYPEGNDNKKLGTVDGVSGATVSWDKDKGFPIHVNHMNPSQQALTDFKNSIVNNTPAISNLTTGANTAIAVQMGLDAMYDNRVVFWPEDM